MELMSVVEVLITYVGCKNTEVEFGRPTVSKSFIQIKNRVGSRLIHGGLELKLEGRHTWRLRTIHGGVLRVVLKFQSQIGLEQLDCWWRHTI